jgi:hypothetical protein
MLIHWENLHAPHGKWHPGRRKTSQQSKNPPCITMTLEKSVHKQQNISIMVKFPMSLSTYSKACMEVWL